MQHFRCPICGVSVATLDELRAHVEESVVHRSRPGQMSGFRQAVDTTRGRILVPVALERGAVHQFERVVGLARHGYLMLDFVSVPRERDDHRVMAVLRAVSEMACRQGVPSARWRLLQPGSPVDRLIEDVRADRPDLVCLPGVVSDATSADSSPGEHSFATVRRRVDELTRRLGVAVHLPDGDEVAVDMSSASG